MPDYEYGIGTRVLITDALDRHELNGLHGVIEAFEPIEDMEEITIPRILLDCGEVLYGCECWWVPERIAAEIETIVELEGRS